MTTHTPTPALVALARCHLETGDPTALAAFGRAAYAARYRPSTAQARAIVRQSGLLEAGDRRAGTLRVLALNTHHYGEDPSLAPLEGAALRLVASLGGLAEAPAPDPVPIRVECEVTVTHLYPPPWYERLARAIAGLAAAARKRLSRPHPLEDWSCG